jgi:membrane protein
MRQSVHRGTVNSIIAVGDRIWAAGSAGLLINSTGRHTSWKGETGTGFIIALLNFFGPFVFIWLSFLLVYQLLPNVRVPFKPAAIGAAITGAIWVGFLLGFIVYVKSFANGTFAVYGALAAFPIFLLLIYSSAVIILFGAEVSYMIVFLDTHLHRKRMKVSLNEIPVYSGIRMLHAIFQKFERDGGATEPETLATLCENPREVEYFLAIFRDANLILDREGGGILPATSSDNIRFADVLAMIQDASLKIPSNAPNDILRKKLGDLFQQMNAAQKDILGDMRLSAVIKG